MHRRRLTLASLIAPLILLLAACSQAPAPQAARPSEPTVKALALTPGTVVAWGYNDYGQLNVPAGLNNVIALEGGTGHTLALKSDGTVVAWGYNLSGQVNIPAGLSGVTAIAAGGYHSLALKTDGTVVGWGQDLNGQATPPAGLTGVTAIAAGVFHSLALGSDGTVVGWGQDDDGQATPPVGLSDVTAIAAGGSYSLALKSDGTVVGWGDNRYYQLRIPAGLSGVTAIAAAQTDALALKSDGTVVTWGRSQSLWFTVPAGLNNVVAIAAGRDHALAIVPTDTTPPVITPTITGTLGLGGWYTSTINLTWSVTDGESTISSQTGCDNQSVTSDTAGVTFTCTATSAGGTDSKSVTVKRDATAPSLNPVVSPNPVLLNGSASVASNPADTLSGLASQSCGTLNTSSVGTKSVTCTATDNAGNTSSKSVNYSVIYTFQGFYFPVQNAPAVNTVKAGWVVPLSFILGGNFGPGAVTGANSTPVNCTTFAPIGAAQVAMQGNGAWQSAQQMAEQSAAGWGLENRGMTAQAVVVYVYLWQTNKTWKNTCRQFVLTLNDGTTHAANFRFQ